MEEKNSSVSTLSYITGFVPLWLIGAEIFGCLINPYYFASVCHTGEEIEAAARRLGHSPEMFMNTYARHSSDETENKLLERLCDA